MKRCKWIEGKPDYYVKYHDEVWGVPEYRDRELFKWLILETFHVGLSWQLVLSKYDNFCLAFDDFDYNKISQYTGKDIERLLDDSGIIRHKGKIEATITNAQAFLNVQEEWGSFSEYIWSFTDGKVIDNLDDIHRTKSPLSDKVTKSLKKYGFKFVGSVTVYSYLQAIGVINDHDLACDFYPK